MIRCMLAGLLFTAIACNKDYLEKKPLTEYREEDVWTDQGLVEGFVNDMYLNMRHGFNEVMLSSMTDESRFIHDYSTSRVVEGNMSADDMGAANAFGDWNKHYKVIRNCNMFFEKVDKVPFTDESLRTRLKGEVHFLRAWYYHILVKYFGGVPLITYTFSLDNPAAMIVKRNAFSTCVNFIAAECDRATSLLPLRYEETQKSGRATRAAAMALKSRILLYAASDLYNINVKDTVNGYTDGNVQQRRQAAKAAAEALINLNAFSLYRPADSAALNYSSVFTVRDNPELIFVKLFDKALLGTSHDLYNGPNGYHNWGGNVPLENFISGYQMADGTPFSWGNPVMAKNPYRNRDPRFYATILHDGARWKKRPKDASEADPTGIIQTGLYEQGSGKDSIWGLDTRGSSIENWNGTFSGYYLRKFMDINLDAQFYRGNQSWIFFRYAEILLNYAEACLYLGQDAEARDKINMVRTRAGMPATNAAGTALLEVYRYERRYELAFEEHRFFDVRRWKLGAQYFNESAKGIEIKGSKIAGHPFSYRVMSIQNRKFGDKDYFLPIPADERRKNNELVQNPGY